MFAFLGTVTVRSRFVSCLGAGVQQTRFDVMALRDGPVHGTMGIS
jgi:hypothetical protein